MIYALAFLVVAALVVAAFAAGRMERAAERLRRVNDAKTAFRDYAGAWTAIAAGVNRCPHCGQPAARMPGKLLAPEPTLTIEALNRLQ